MFNNITSLYISETGLFEKLLFSNNVKTKMFIHNIELKNEALQKDYTGLTILEICLNKLDKKLVYRLPDELQMLGNPRKYRKQLNYFISTIPYTFIMITNFKYESHTN